MSFFLFLGVLVHSLISSSIPSSSSLGLPCWSHLAHYVPNQSAPAGPLAANLFTDPSRTQRRRRLPRTQRKALNFRIRPPPVSCPPPPYLDRCRHYTCPDGGSWLIHLPAKTRGQTIERAAMTRKRMQVDLAASWYKTGIFATKQGVRVMILPYGLVQYTSVKVSLLDMFDFSHDMRSALSDRTVPTRCCPCDVTGWPPRCPTV